jgi:plasmid stabilization system protein ParE
VNYRLLSGAEHEYAVSLLYYFNESPTAADGFMEEVKAALIELTSFPKRYRIYKRDVRVKSLHRYPFSIYYRVTLDEILVLSISHNSRKPDHWAERE